MTSIAAEKISTHHVEDSKHISTENPPIDLHAEEQGEKFTWNKDVILNLFALYFTFWCTTWTYSIVPTSLAFIDKAFPTQTGITYWIASSPGLCQCVLSLFIGELSDIFGRRWFLLFGNLCMLVGNIVVGRGSTAEMVIGGQVVAGVGLSLGFLVTPLLAECVPKKNRGLVVALGGLFSGVALTGGAMAQGACAEFNVGGLNQGWRVGAYLGAGWGLIALILVFVFYHPGRRPNPQQLSTKARFFMIDWVGLFLGTAGLIIFLVGIDSGSNPYPWNSARIIAMIVVGAILLIVFALWEWKGAKFGLFPRAVFQHRNFAIGLAAYFIEGMVINSATAYLSQINLSLFTTNQLLSLVRSLQLGLGAMVGSGIAAFSLGIWRDARWTLVGAMIMSTLGCGLMALLQPHMNYAAFFFPVALIGVSIGIVGTVVPVVVSLCTPNEFIATAISLSTSARGLGGSIGIVITSQVFTSKIKVKLPLEAATAVAEAGLPLTSIPQLLEDALGGMPQLIPMVPGITPAVIEALSKAAAQAYADSWRFVWYVLLPFNGVVLLLVFLLKSTKAQMTKEVASAVLEIHNHHHHDDEKIAMDA